LKGPGLAGRLCRFVLLGGLWAGALPAAVLDVPETAERLPLGHALEYFFDETGRIDLAAAIRDGRYRPAAGDSLTFGRRPAVLWARMALRNPGAAPFERWLHVEPERLDQARLFLPEPGGGWRRLDNGLQVAVARRPVPDRGIVFPLRLEAGQTLTLYLRIETRNPLSLLPVLWMPAAFQAAARAEDLFAMLGFGALLGLAGYAIVLFPLQRDRAALYLGLEMVFIGLFEAAYNGYGYTYLWPDRPDWAWWPTPLCALLGQASFNRFLRAFLPLDTQGPRLGRHWLDGLFLVDLALIAKHLLRAPSMELGPALPLLFAIASLSNLGVTLAVAMRGYRPARLAAAGMLPTLGLMLPRIGEVLGWLPLSSPGSPAVTAAVMFVSNLCFFAAISRRVDLLRRDKDAAQAFALRTQREAAARLETQVAERTAELVAARDRAERADRAKGEFLARVSHELRTPLHTILGYAHLLRRDLPAGRSGERLVLLEEGGIHLARLIDDLLDYARGERDRLALDPRPAFLGRLLARLEAHGAALAARQRNRFAARRGEDLPPVARVDARRLEQVMLILLANAARYTRDGDIALAVAVCAEPPGAARLRFAVEDTGIGIAPADLARIFEPFERAAGSGPSEGLGLGLAIGRQLVRAMGGELKVASRPGAGSRFWFEIELPLAAEADIPCELPDLDILGYEGPPRRLLVVEDHAPNRRLLEQFLSDLGFEVRAAADCAGGREALRSGNFDLALLDQRLPDGSGWDLLRVLRSDPATAGRPAILLSAMPAEPPADLRSTAGFEAVLLKPVEGGELLDAIGRLLGLGWRRAPGVAESAPVPPSPWAEPERRSITVAERAELAGFARQGAVYEIEDWIERRRDSAPEDAAFLERLEARLAVLDFEGITEAAMAGGAGAVE
jgi:signal transduction histidine kinase/DNA-binding NarL/FixJ family response regulator